jgi:hypothetical protein
MSFRILGLSPQSFRPYFEMSDAELAAAGALRHVVAEPGLPCRVSLEHARIGDEILLVNFEHQPALTPYRSRHAIYVSRGATRAFDEIDVIPETIATRLIAVRAFDADAMMIDADVVDGSRAAETFERLLANRDAAYLHVHNAKRGCYAAKVERVIPA